MNDNKNPGDYLYHHEPKTKHVPAPQPVLPATNATKWLEHLEIVRTAVGWDLVMVIYFIVLTVLSALVPHSLKDGFLSLGYYCVVVILLVVAICLSQSRKPFNVLGQFLLRWFRKRPWYVVFFVLIFLPTLLAALFNFHDPTWAMQFGFLLPFLPMLALDSWELRKVKKYLTIFGLLDTRASTALSTGDSSFLSAEMRRSDEVIESIIDRSKLH